MESKGGGAKLQISERVGLSGHLKIDNTSPVFVLTINCRCVLILKSYLKVLQKRKSTDNWDMCGQSSTESGQWIKHYSKD